MATTKCGYYELFVPDPIATISGPEMEVHDVSQNLILDASASIEPLSLNGPPGDLKVEDPQEIQFEWYCWVEETLPVPQLT